MVPLNFKLILNQHYEPIQKFNKKRRKEIIARRKGKEGGQSMKVWKKDKAKKLERRRNGKELVEEV